MTKEDVIERLKVEQGYYDKENAHIEADRILTEFLIYLGYQDVVDEFEKIDKWYA